jgi:serine/threonine protein phosphatase PrpC
MKMYGMTDIGRVRATNQDFYAVKELDENCFYILVCDGMGGHKGGNIAGETRVLTTAIVMEVSRGNFGLAMALSIILMVLVFLVNFILTTLQQRSKR